MHGEDTVHGTRLEEVVKFVVLSDGESDLLGNGELDDNDPIQDNLATSDDLSDFMWLEPAKSNVEVKKVQHFMSWFTVGVIGSPVV